VAAARNDDKLEDRSGVTVYQFYETDVLPRVRLVNYTIHREDNKVGLADKASYQRRAIVHAGIVAQQWPPEASMQVRI